MGYVRLELCAGPACPRCGCQDAKIESLPESQPAERTSYFGDVSKLDGWHRGSWWGAGRAICRHCGLSFVFREQPATQDNLKSTTEVPLVPEVVDEQKPITKCPDCGGRLHAYKTIGRTQYRRCKDCGKKGPKTIKPLE